MRLEDCTMDAVITSPPYLNKIEYRKVYSIEEELFFPGMKMTALRSYIGAEDEKMMYEGNALKDIMDVTGLPLSARAYFNDMHAVIREMYRVCGRGARIGMVVGNGCFPDMVVESDVILSRMAEEAGFKALEALVLNKRWCTRKRTEKVGIARESLLVWEKGF